MIRQKEQEKVTWEIPYNNDLVLPHRKIQGIESALQDVVDIDEGSRITVQYANRFVVPNVEWGVREVAGYFLGVSGERDSLMLHLQTEGTKYDAREFPIGRTTQRSEPLDTEVIMVVDRHAQTIYGCPTLESNMIKANK